MRYAITHGDRHSGHNPEHTSYGNRQIASLKPIIRELMPVVRRIIIGTGERFQEMEDHFAIGEWPYDGPEQPERFFSPFLGTADGFDPPDRIVIGHRDNGAHPSCSPKEYIGIRDSRFFQPWYFVAMQPENTLFLTGGEFMLALGIAKPHKGSIYRIDPAKKLVELVHLA